MSLKKEVEIHRHYGFIHAANSDPEAKEYFDMAYKAIGSYFKVFGKVYASGLTREEENLLMPDLIGLYPEDKKEFRGAVNEYFKNINTKVPAEGIKLNIALENPNKPIGEDNYPQNVDHYVKYKHAIGHPQVCMSKEEAERRGTLAGFYVVDKVEETKSKSKINRREDDASMFYFQYRDKPSKVEQILVLMGTNPANFTEEERVMKLKELSTIDPAKSDTENQERLEKFINVCSDKDLAIKYDIMEMIRVDILERVQFKILDKTTGEVIGDNLKEAVVWFKDKRNSKDVNVYYVTLEELAKKSSRLMQKEEEEAPKKEIISTPVEMDSSDMDAFTEDETENKES